MEAKSSYPHKKIHLHNFCSLGFGNYFAGSTQTAVW